MEGFNSVHIDPDEAHETKYDFTIAIESNQGESDE